jgi:peptidoglycan hydrolase CwlO-like protein
MTPQQIMPLIGGCVSVGGIIFQMGKHADRLDFLWANVEALEKKEEYMNSTLYEIKGDIKTLTHDINSIKEDICEIKNSWKKK